MNENQFGYSPPITASGLIAFIFFAGDYHGAATTYGAECMCAMTAGACVAAGFALAVWTAVRPRLSHLVFAIALATAAVLVVLGAGPLRPF